ncbi:hypothetical protein OOK36_48385 [Streptomyces sp. NBC_00365]|nr:hypothetical protein [Streptomyces sp. NBC_00365]
MYFTAVPGAIVAAQACVDVSDGIGSITSYATEVALPATGTWKSSGVGCAWADIVLTAPEVGLPLLFIEADNRTEEAPIIAAKCDKYMRHFHRKVKDTDGQDNGRWAPRSPRTSWTSCTPGCRAHRRPRRGTRTPIPAPG